MKLALVIIAAIALSAIGVSLMLYSDKIVIEQHKQDCLSDLITTRETKEACQTSLRATSAQFNTCTKDLMQCKTDLDHSDALIEEYSKSLAVCNTDLDTCMKAKSPKPPTTGKKASKSATTGKKASKSATTGKKVSKSATIIPPPALPSPSPTVTTQLPKTQVPVPVSPPTEVKTIVKTERIETPTKLGWGVGLMAGYNNQNEASSGLFVALPGVKLGGTAVLETFVGLVASKIELNSANKTYLGGQALIVVRL